MAPEIGEDSVTASIFAHAGGDSVNDLLIIGGVAIALVGVFQVRDKQRTPAGRLRALLLIAAGMGLAALPIFGLIGGH